MDDRVQSCYLSLGGLSAEGGLAQFGAGRRESGQETLRIGILSMSGYPDDGHREYPCDPIDMALIEARTVGVEYRLDKALNGGLGIGVDRPYQGYQIIEDLIQPLKRNLRWGHCPRVHPLHHGREKAADNDLYHWVSR